MGEICDKPLKVPIACRENHREYGEINSLNMLFLDKSPKICIDVIFQHKLIIPTEYREPVKGLFIITIWWGIADVIESQLHLECPIRMT